MLDYNPASISALTQLMQGGLVPGREGGLLFARLRYFDPEKKRAGVPADVAALVSELTDTKTVVTLVNTSDTDARTVIVQGGAYGEHRFVSVEHEGRLAATERPHLRRSPRATVRSETHAHDETLRGASDDHATMGAKLSDARRELD